MTTGHTTLGVDVGGTKMLSVTRDALGTTHVVDRRPTGRTLSVRDLVGSVKELGDATRASGLELDAVGIGFPGLVDPVTGQVRSSVILDGWNEVDLPSEIRAATGLPCVVDNDVNMAARAERALRADEHGENFAFIAAGTGIGGALVLNGTVWSGASGLAGEVGHVVVSNDGPRCVCGRIGCVGALAGGEAIERSLGIHPGGSESLATSSGALVTTALETAGRHLGMAIADLLHLLDLKLVVLGGGLAQHTVYFQTVSETALSQVFDEVAAGCRIELPRGGYESGAVGAALHAATAIPQP